MVLGHDLHYTDVLSMYFVMISMSLVTPHTTWSNAVLKLPIFQARSHAGILEGGGGGYVDA